MADFVSGRLYFIKDEFFEVVGEKYLKANKRDAKRPHYYAFRDSSTGLLWVIPCSSQVEKYKKIIENKEKNAKEIMKLMKHGIKFTPTQPDCIRIEKMMIEELNKEENETI